MSLFDGLSVDSQRRLAACDIHFDAQLADEEQRALEVVEEPGDRARLTDFYEDRRSRGVVRSAVMPLVCGAIASPAPPPGGHVQVVRRHRRRTNLDQIDDRLGPLARAFRDLDGYPTRQRYGSCAAHASGTSLNLQGERPGHFADSPSRRFLHVMSRITGGHGDDEGRSFLDLQEVLFDQGYLTEAECPTGRNDDFDERETFSAEKLRRARRRRCAGAVWIDGNRTRVEAAIDLVKGRITGQPISMLIAVRIHDNWRTGYHSGVIRRHSRNEKLLGYHALVILDFVALQGKVWAVIGNSWGPEFGASSPIGIPGTALVSMGYLEEILVHGAVVFCEDAVSYEALLGGFDLARAGGALAANPTRRAAATTMIGRIGRGWWHRTRDRLVFDAVRRLGDSGGR